MRKLLLLLPPWTPVWIFLPVLEPEQRHLVLWSYRLMVRVQTIAWVVAIVAPFATVGLISFLSRKSDALASEVAALKRALRERRRRRAIVAAHHGEAVPNPWV